MAFVKVKVPRTSQPQDACGIDWGNPLATGLTSVWFGDDEWILGPIKSNPIGLSKSLGVVGHGRAVFNGPLNTGLPTGSFNTSVDESRLALVRVPTSTAANNISCAYAAGAMQIRIVNGTDLVLVEKSVAVRITAAASVVSGEICTVGSSRNATQSALYKNGNLLGTGLGRATLSPGQPCLCQDGGSANYFTDTLFFHAAWNRVLSSDEFKSISENPWQIFEPEELTIWVPDEVGAGDYNHLVTLLSSKQANSASLIGITQAHTVGLSSSSANKLSAHVGIQQTHLLTVASSKQYAISGYASVSQGAVHLVGLATSAQSNTSSSVAVSSTALAGLKYWNGSSWQLGTLRYWSGSAWLTGTLRYWNGSTWSTP